MSTLRVAAINNASAGSGGLAFSATGNVTGAGLDLITSQSFTAASTVSVNNCFTGAYENYRIMLKATGTTGAGVLIRMRSGGVDNSAASYNNQYVQGTGGTVAGAAQTAQTGGTVSTVRNGLLAVTALDIFNPALAEITAAVSTVLDPTPTISVSTFTMNHTVASAFDGFTIYPGAGTFTGTLRVYGYRN